MLILNVSGSISQKTGFAPVKLTVSAVDTQVNDGNITSSPRPIPRDLNAIKMASTDWQL